jgi:pimeloyl-ACP methyl ester carboxylesterase
MLPVVLLHGSANGSYAWGPVRAGLEAAGVDVYVPDMLGYGAAPAPSERWDIAEEVRHLVAWLGERGVGELHLVPHSLGSMIGLHLRRGLGERVRRLTLVDPVAVSVLVEHGEEAGLAEMVGQYEAFMGREGDPAAAARGFVEHWSGPGAFDAIGGRARSAITALVPKVGMEMRAMRGDTTPTAVLAPPGTPATILLGERTRLAPRGVALHLAASLGAPVVVVPGAGHMIPVTHPEAVVAAVLAPPPP